MYVERAAPFVALRDMPCAMAASRRVSGGALCSSARATSSGERLKATTQFDTGSISSRVRICVLLVRSSTRHWTTVRKKGEIRRRNGVSTNRPISGVLRES